MQHASVCEKTNLKEREYGPGEVAILRVPVPSAVAARVRVRYHVSQPQAVSYVACGWRGAEGFIHAKQRHLPTGVTFTQDITPEDLCIKLERGWSASLHPVAHFEVWVKFAERCTSALEMECEFFGPSAAEETLEASATELAEIHGLESRRLLCSQMLEFGDLAKFDDSVALADKMLKEHVMCLADGHVLDLLPNGDFVNGYESLTNTQRYLVHALFHVALLLVAYNRTGRHEYLFMARQHTARWLSANFDQQPADMKFSYYDHGTADRARVLLALRMLVEPLSINVSDLTRLDSAIEAHARLLSSWTFVSKHQRTFLHNHAVFQAISCILLGACAPSPTLGETCIQFGTQILCLQVCGLVNQEGISIENSTAYHLGLHRVLTNALTLLLRSGVALPPEVANLKARIDLMPAFLERVCFSGRRMPAVGDSKYSLSVPQRRWAARRNSIVLNRVLEMFPLAGYASVVDDVGDGREMSLLVVASSLSDTHKHDDDLSLSIASSDGIQWIADPGYHSYDESPLSLLARSSISHNAPVVVGAEYKRGVGNSRIRGKSTDQLVLVAGEHRNYPRARLVRVLVWSRLHRMLVVQDQLTGSYEAGALIAWTLGDEVSVQLLDEFGGAPHRSYRLRHAAGKDGPVVTAVDYPAKPDDEGKLFPPEGVVGAARIIGEIKSGGLGTTFTTVFSWGASAPDPDVVSELLSQAKAEALLNDT